MLKALTRKYNARGDPKTLREFMFNNKNPELAKLTQAEYRDKNVFVYLGKAIRTNNKHDYYQYVRRVGTLKPDQIKQLALVAVEVDDREAVRDLLNAFAVLNIFSFRQHGDSGNQRHTEKRELINALIKKSLEKTRYIKETGQYIYSNMNGYLESIKGDFMSNSHYNEDTSTFSETLYKNI